MSKWLYRSETGERLAELSLDDAPPIGWPIIMVGPDMGPVRHYRVVAVDREESSLTLRSGVFS
jgi:hypothetical protein